MVCLLLNGCAIITHDYVDKDGNHDKGKMAAFMTTSAITKIRTSTKNDKYNHSTTGDGVNITGDAAFIEALTAGIVKGLKTSQGIP